MVDVLKIVIKGDDDFSKTFKKFRLSMDANVAKAAIAGGAAIAAYTAATYASVKATAEAYDQVGKFAGRIGISTEALSAYNHVAELSGISTQTLNMGFQRMTRRIAEASQGMGVAKNALAELGIPINDIQSLAPDKQFEMIAKSMDGLANQSDKVRLAMQFFDSEGVALIQTLQGGSEGLEAMKEEAVKFGLVISTKAAANAAAFNDSLTRSMGAIKGVRNAFSEDLMPMITGLQNAFADFVADNRKQIVEFVKNFSVKMLEFAEKGAYAIGILIDAWRGLKMTFQVLKIVFNEQVKLYLKGMDFLIEKAVDFMNRFNVGGVFDDAIQKAQAFSEGTKIALEVTTEAAEEASASLRAIADEGLATKKVEEYVDKVKSVLDEIKAKSEAGEETGIAPFDNANIAKTQSNITRLQEMWNEQFLTQEEQLNLWYEKQQELYTGNEEALTMLSEVYTAKRDQIAEDSREKQLKLDQDAKNKRLSAASAFFNTLNTLGQASGEKGFKLIQAAAAGEAIMNAHKAATGAYAALAWIPLVGPALGRAAQIAAYAAGFARVQQIKSQKFEARQSGGAVFGGNSYLVGEAGAELFVPRQSGEIVPNDALVGGGIGQVNIEVLPNATNIDAMLGMGKDAWQEITEDKILPAMRTLAQAGITA